MRRGERGLQVVSRMIGEEEFLDVKNSELWQWPGRAIIAFKTDHLGVPLYSSSFVHMIQLVSPEI